jgi:hypothetical protein
MGAQAGSRRGRSLTNTEQPTKDEQGNRIPANGVTSKQLEEQGEQQHVKHTPRDQFETSAARPIKNPPIYQVGAETQGPSPSRSMRSISREPPVTKATLSELDVPRIVFNPKLRHDVNFDPDLHFRPNLDGEKGRRKTQKANDFWDCLREQLEAFTKDQAAFMADLAGRKWCLPLTLHAIGDILATLVPPEDRPMVEEILNVDLLMQQFGKGVADLEQLAKWLSRTLKSHCAPMRDEWVDEMVVQLSTGNANQDITLLVRGLHTLLGILEAMKLVGQSLS